MIVKLCDFCREEITHVNDIRDAAKKEESSTVNKRQYVAILLKLGATELVRSTYSPPGLKNKDYCKYCIIDIINRHYDDRPKQEKEA